MSLPDRLRRLLPASPAALRRAGVLGLNARNRLVIAPQNSRTAIRHADEKELTQAALAKAGLAHVERLGKIQSLGDFANLLALIERNDGQVALKPARGAGGAGILVLAGPNGAGPWATTDGKTITVRSLLKHCEDILSGQFSLNGQPDQVLAERRVTPNPALLPFSPHGLPDLRVVVSRGWPVMAMLRLATKASGGRANLHQGGVGLGLDLATGRVIHAIQFGRVIHAHPDSGLAFDTVRIPHWEETLTLAAGCLEALNLGYLGADIVHDAVRGPLLLEVNARPGLAIQLACGAGLAPQLAWADRQSAATPRDRARVVMTESLLAPSGTP